VWPVRFWLGAHQSHWLGLADVPLMVSHRTLARRRWLPQARGPWALDSGAFSEIAAHGHFQTSPSAYVAAVRRYADEIGHLAWAVPQDWMCEPAIILGLPWQQCVDLGLCVEDGMHDASERRVRARALRRGDCIEPQSQLHDDSRA
jgi:hypothetical protein